MLQAYESFPVCIVVEKHNVDVLKRCKYDSFLKMAACIRLVCNTSTELNKDVL
jgi:hypothetical protein